MGLWGGEMLIIVAGARCYLGPRRISSRWGKQQIEPDLGPFKLRLKLKLAAHRTDGPSRECSPRASSHRTSETELELSSFNF